MTLALNTALDLLRDNPTAYDSLEKLRALAAQVSTEAAPGYIQGKVTVLYSRQIADKLGSQTNWGQVLQSNILFS